MARITCKCGETLWNGKTPNEIELIVYSDEEWSKILDNDVIETWKIPEPKYDVWRCPKCKRIYCFSSESDKTFMTYCLEQ